ncbi:hypothetical protein SAMN06295967_109111 [Belliella buryatensis]|uniref:Uncharacterized protein n=1 Tax=Belliella buryatensis TaxID=1500549 RepID=A0A239EF33_9BACT|nr:hypothetical protein [Belliella buryatensis]SNS43149.1 hypothetical protein SAMN06295967_109111 [Belliella buryatensis]
MSSLYFVVQLLTNSFIHSKNRNSSMKLLGIIGILALMMTFGCNDKAGKEVVKETRIEVKTEKEAGTQIKINKDGGSVKTKNVEVEVNNDKN